MGCSKSCTRAALGVILLSSEHHWWVNNQPPGSTFLWSRSAALCFYLPVSLIITLSLIITPHLTCSLCAFHIQPRSMCLFLAGRLTPCTLLAVSSVSLSHSFSVHLVTAQIYYCNLSVLLSCLPTHSVATNMHMLLLVLYRHIHWRYKKPRADKQRWLNVVSMKSNSPMTHYEHLVSVTLPKDEMQLLQSYTNVVQMVIWSAT